MKDRRREAVHSTHGHRREAWKTAKSSGVMERGYPKYRYADCHQSGFGLLLGQAHSVVMERPSGRL